MKFFMLWMAGNDVDAV
jgi:hypothetical protein